MSAGRWQRDALPPRLLSVLASAQRDHTRADAHRAALERRLGALGVLPNAAPPPGAPPPGTPSPGAAPASGSSVATNSVAGGAGSTYVAAGGTSAGVLALSAKAWVSALLIATLSGVGSYAVVRNELRADSSQRAASPPALLTAAPLARSSIQAPDGVAPTMTAAPGAVRRRRATSEARGLRVEVKLLDAMRSQLNAAPDAALRHADRHARAFPNGALAQERELLRVEALLAGNRLPEACVIAENLQRDFPGSAYARRAARLTADVQSPARGAQKNTRPATWLE